MKLLAPLSAASLAAAASPAQQVLQQPLHEAARQPLDAFHRVFADFRKSTAPHNVSEKLKAEGEKLTKAFYSAAESVLPPPKAPRRRPDSYWDAVVRGKDLQDVQIARESGARRKPDGELSAYTMRSKKVDPGELDVDPNAKQYSGYLDDEEEDKHLFYCKQAPYYFSLKLMNVARVLRVSQ